jgi:hypothetical protein
MTAPSGPDGTPVGVPPIPRPIPDVHTADARGRVVPADHIPPADPPTDIAAGGGVGGGIPGDVPQADIPQADVPQADIPRTQIPPTDNPPTDIAAGGGPGGGVGGGVGGGTPGAGARVPRFRAPRDGGQILSAMAFAFAAVAVLIYPAIFGLAAIVLGFVALRRGEPLARRAIIAGAAGIAIGYLLGVIVVNARG